tara:strand:+ start:465 stop:716 length:252 start_codon:yes stop_codon:yes gene_type:complete
MLESRPACIEGGSDYIERQANLSAELDPHSVISVFTSVVESLTQFEFGSSESHPVSAILLRFIQDLVDLADCLGFGGLVHVFI